MIDVYIATLNAVYSVQMYTLKTCQSKGLPSVQKSLLADETKRNQQNHLGTGNALEQNKIQKYMNYTCVNMTHVHVHVPV